jgi:thymidylate synthase
MTEAWETPIKTFTSEDKDILNHNIWYTEYNYGKDFVFGDPTEIKHGKRIYRTVAFRGKALEDINAGNMPEAWDFKGDAVREYGKQFFDRKSWYIHEYSYAARLLEYEITNPNYPKTFLGLLGYVLCHLKMPPLTVKVDQLKRMREQLIEAFKNDIQSTRIIGITFRPGEDYLRNDIPCLQFVMVFPLGGRKVSTIYYYRSQDDTNGLMANAHYLNNGLLRHVIEPAGGRLVETIFTTAIAHLYKTDFSTIEKELFQSQNLETEYPRF